VALRTSPADARKGESRMALFEYRTYQDVRSNLLKYTIGLLNLAGFLSLFVIVSPAHRDTLTSLAKKVSETPFWSDTLKNGIAVVVFSALAYLLIEVLQVHDKVYDRYFVRWRFRYDTDFILPRLCRHHLGKMGIRFFDEAENNLYEFMKALFYPYAMDNKSDEPKIEQNYLVRFYELVANYWITQVNEIVMLLLFGLATLYATVWDDGTARSRLLMPLLLLMAVFAVNRWFVHRTREAVRRGTSDEIEAILEKHQQDLEGRLERICERYAIPF
jgi:hypothetical protein